MEVNNDLIYKAVIFASKKHFGSVRKGDGQPYIFHPLEVLGVVSLLTNDEDILAASVLHDTIEDTDTTKEEIIKEFNEHIADLVASESEDKRKGQNKDDTWLDRKKEAIKSLKNAKDIGSKMICIGDKISNLRSLNRLILDKGDEAWNNFHMKDPKMHYWYYDGIRQALEDLKDTNVYKEYCFLIDAVFSKYVKEK